MATTDKQVKLLKTAYEKTGCIETASAKAGLCQQTGSKYLKEDRPPSELQRERHWRTREDPFETDWPTVAGMSADAPELEGKALFEWLCERAPERYVPGQLRTFSVAGPGVAGAAWSGQRGPFPAGP